MSGLIIEHLTKSFDGHIVLEDINIEARAGELLVILGPSGCGKSTLLRLIAGLEQPDRGKIIIDEKDVTTLEPQKRKTAMVFQNYALYPHMTVFDNIAFPLKVARISPKEIATAVEKTARLLELDQMLKRRPAQLSGGQRQRVALGRGLVRQPSIFLLDEPLSNLDAALRVKMRQEIVSLQKHFGITMIYVTHDQTEALTMADRMVVISEGRIRQYGSPLEIYEDPQDSFVASFIGTPTINLVEDQIAGGKGAVFPVDFGSEIPEGRYLIGIRPEHIHIRDDGLLSGEVKAAEYVGSAVHLRITVGHTAITVTESAREDLAKKETADQLIGRTYRFDIDRRKIFFFDPDTKDRIVFGL